MANSVYDFKVKNAQGQMIDLSQYKGKVILVVNVASKCGFTSQYTGLESIYKKYESKGFVILGFPCNQFGAQEPGTDQDIQQFCKLTYDVNFPVMAKVEVNGDKAEPFYQYLKSASPGLLGSEAIKWNFTKFLIGRDGKVLERYAPQTTPEALASDIEKALG